VFRRAGRALSTEYINSALATLEDRKLLKGKSGEYYTYINRIRRHEKDMEAAAVFAGPAADDVLIELWKFGLTLGESEFWRLYVPFERKFGDRRQIHYTEAKEYKATVKKLNDIVDQWWDYFRKLRSYGFYQSNKGQLERIKEPG